MSIPSNAVARGTGITVNFKDLAGGAARFLPQRIAVFAQGQEGVSYSTDKFAITGGSKQVGDALGYSSPAYHVAQQLFPAFGDGVGIIPVDMYPLAAPVGAASVGALSVSGSTSAASTYTVNVGGIESQQFLIEKGTIDANLINYRMANAINNVLGMPVLAASAYDTPIATPGGTNVGDGAVSALAVTASQTPVGGDWKLVCTLAGPAAEFSLTDSEGTLVDSSIVAGSIVDAGGIDFTLSYGATDFELGDEFTITVGISQVDLTVQWLGETGNKIRIEVEGPFPSLGAVFAVTQVSGGAGFTDVTPALAQLGETWTTMLMYAGPDTDVDAFDAFSLVNEARWDTLVHTPFVAFYGTRRPNVTAATEETIVRQTDRTTCQLVAPDSINMPWVIASAQLVNIATRANENPPYDYGSMRTPSITPGKDASQWNYALRDTAIKQGSSTIEVKDGVVNISDVITPWSPTGEEPPAYRFVVDIVKLQNVIYNVDLEFGGERWDGKPLIPDGDPTNNPEAVTPSMAKAALAGILDGLGLAAIISDPARAKETIVAAIDGTNPKRLNLSCTVQVSGNTNIKNIIINWGFFFGG